MVIVFFLQHSFARRWADLQQHFLCFVLSCLVLTASQLGSVLFCFHYMAVWASHDGVLCGSLSLVGG